MVSLDSRDSFTASRTTLPWVLPTSSSSEWSFRFVSFRFYRIMDIVTEMKRLTNSKDFFQSRGEAFQIQGRRAGVLACPLAPQNSLPIKTGGASQGGSACSQQQQSSIGRIAVHMLRLGCLLSERAAISGMWCATLETPVLETSTTV